MLNHESIIQPVIDHYAMQGRCETQKGVLKSYSSYYRVKYKILAFQ